MEAAPEYFHGGYYCGGAAAGEKQGEHFIVEDLLDLSNEQGEEETGGLGMGDDGGASGHSVDSPSAVTVVDSCSNSFSIHEQHFSGNLACRSLAGDGISGDLCEPYEELAELEWLSNIVEDSFSSDDLQKLHLISGIKSSSSSSSENISSVTTASDVAADGRTAQPAALFGPETPVPGKARSKRSRAAPCNWSSRLLVLSSTPDSSSSESNVVGAAIPANSGKKASKPAKKKDPSEGPNYAASDGRKCLHCATDKTPQWRTGPMGPKTLCNACGVRYKSGRLVPEYRPAASPTFVLSKHSNSHRKVLELRRQKELHLQLQQQQQQQQSFLHLSGGGGYDGSAGDDFLIHHHIGPDFRQLI